MLEARDTANDYGAALRRQPTKRNKPGKEQRQSSNKNITSAK